MSINDFITSANDEIDSIMGTDTLKILGIHGQSFPVVTNSRATTLQGEAGGMVPNFAAQVTAQPGNISGDPQSLKGARATMSGKEYRIYSVNDSPVSVDFVLCHPSDTR